jgi:hypothetical protein
VRRLQAETLRAESEKLSEMSGDDSEQLNELLKVKIRELSEASAKAATADSLQKELNEKVKEAIELQARLSTAEAAQKEQGRELEELRAKLREVHSETPAGPPLVRASHSHEPATGQRRAAQSVCVVCVTQTEEAAKAAAMSPEDEVKLLRRQSFAVHQKCEALGRRLMAITGRQWRLGVVAVAFRTWKNFVRYKEFDEDMEAHARGEQDGADPSVRVEKLEKELEKLRAELADADAQIRMLQAGKGGDVPTGVRRSTIKVGSTPALVSNGVGVDLAEKQAALEELRATHRTKAAELEALTKELESANAAGDKEALQILREQHVQKKQEADEARRQFLDNIQAHSKLVTETLSMSISKVIGRVADLTATRSN